MNTPKITAWVNGATYCSDGQSFGYFTTGVDIKINRLWWQEKGLSYTASGYGSRIPTEYMVKFNGKWRRVYCMIYSNAGTLYIGKLPEFGERLHIRIDAE